MDNRSLAFLASQSAVFLECYSSGIELDENWSTVGYLSEEMDYISKNQSIENSAMLLRLIWPKQKDWEGRTLDDVYLHANLLAKDLKYFKEFSRRKQSDLSDICLRLSMIASERSIYDLDYNAKFGLVA